MKKPTESEVRYALTKVVSLQDRRKFYGGLNNPEWLDGLARLKHTQLAAGHVRSHDETVQVNDFGQTRRRFDCFAGISFSFPRRK